MYINKLNISNKAYSNQISNFQNNYFKFNSSNLKPLNKDTVSFSSSATLTGESMKYAPSGHICSQVYKNSESANFYLSKVLEKYVEPINEGALLGEEPIKIFVRTKSPKSIREKVSSKFAKITKEEKNKFCDAAVNQIFNNFTVKSYFTSERAKIESKILLDFLTIDNNIPPYKNEKYFLETIIADLEKRNLIKFETDNLKEKEIAIDKMVKELETVSSTEHCDINSLYIEPSSVNGVKHYANDIIGARIILNNPKAMPKVIEALKAASDAGLLNITSVENIIPDAKKLPPNSKMSEYEYLPARKLKKFADKTYSNYKEVKSKSGYMAVHINLDLSNNELKTKKNEYNGYSGEIQIMDSFVEDFKEVEDLCYKIKDNKNFLDKKYDAFKNHFKKYYKDPKVKEAFDNYTYDLYLFQRTRSVFEANHCSRNFPDLKFFEYDKIIPEELDFNELKKRKNKCETKRKSSLNDNNNNNNSSIGQYLYQLTNDAPDRFRRLLFNIGLTK